MKYLLLITALIVLVGGGWYVADTQGLFQTKPKMGEPTAEERARIEQVESQSNRQADDARPGIGVRMQGDLPPQVESTSTATTTEKESAEAGDDEAENTSDEEQESENVDEEQLPVE